MAKYDPSKQYRWEEEDSFTMRGDQFGLILNAFRTYLSKKESAETMLIIKAEAAMTEVLAKGVEDGFVHEMKPEGAPQEKLPKMSKT